MSSSRDSTSDTGRSESPASSTRDDTLISSTEYALRCREFLELLRDLNKLGTDKYFDMPRITVIGGQSAGKSSLVEAVSGINVPRDSGTCTRCPMECSMSSNTETWSCQITLRYSIDQNGQALPTGPERAVFGPPIPDKHSVELWLRRAQAAILSPHIDHTDFYSKTLEELQAMRNDPDVLLFSKNVIEVEVKDPELTDLSFIDLPGLIQNSETDVINLVRELVESHIAGQNTLILVTIPMSDDIENQQAVRLAKMADPDGERTIGVLTKPDTLPPGASGARRRWMGIIEGDSSHHQLKHGYYCVRLPDDDERARNMSRTESSNIAAEFFNSTPPWNTITSHNRFGVSNLVRDLSLILVGLIEKNLPDLRNAIDERLRACHVELAELPPPLATDPSTEFLLRVTAFCSDFHAAVFGETRKHLVQHNRQQFQRFKSDIFKTCPDFRPFEDYTKYRHPPTLSEHGPDEYARMPMDLNEVQKVIDASIGWELPDYVPFAATQELVLKITEQWKGPSHACFERIFDNSKRFVDELVQHHFGQFKLLDAHISDVVGTELDKIKASALQAVDKTLELEYNPIFTQNTDFFASERRRWFSAFTDIRHRHMYHLIGERPISGSQMSAFSEVGNEQIPEDKFHQALSVMVNVRAYFQVTYKRIIDYIPLVIEHELQQSAWTNFKESIFQSLPKGQDAPERTRALLSEDPMVSRRRSQLQGKKDKLVQIQRRLEDFHRKIDRMRGA